MFRIGAALFVRGALGALVSGALNTAVLFILFAPSAGTSIKASTFLFPGIGPLALSIIVLGLLFAPVTMALLPLAWLSFRRSPYRRVALCAIGLFGGVLWSIK